MSATPEILAQGRWEYLRCFPPYSLKGLLESRSVQFAIRSRGLGVVSFYSFYRSGWLWGNELFDDFGHMGWKCAQDGLRGNS